jgi:lipoteichoic acid synthase
MLHLWTVESFLFGRLVSISLLALGFGCVLGLLSALMPRPKAERIFTATVSFLLAVLYLIEFFLVDAYGNFMPFVTIFAGAGGVATGFLDVILSVVVRDLWRIGLMLAPTVLYLYLTHAGKTGWKLRGILAAGGVAGYLLGIGAVHVLTVDASRLSETYNFDSAVRSFGMHMAMELDLTRSAVGTEDEVDFEPLPTMPSIPTLPQTEPTGPQTTEPTEPIVYEKNVMDLDFAALAEAAGNTPVANIHRYVGSLQPSEQNRYTGLFRGKNLIFITAEAFTIELIDPVMTPTLYRLANQGIRFTDYYQPAWGASTTSGEYSNLVGLVPTNGGSCMFETRQQNLLLTIGNQLKAQGYSSAAYHNNDYTFYSRHSTHTFLGYDKYIGYGNGIEEGVTSCFPESDLEMIDLTIPWHIDQQPFSLYYMTVSGHSVYKLNSNAMARKNYDAAKDLPYSETVQCYFACNLELEYAMASMIAQLEEAGIADDTVIVLATDHYPYGLEKSSTWGNDRDYLSELYGKPVSDCFIRDHNALIIWSGSIEGMDIVVDTPVSSLDILPTLSNLFGVTYDSRLLVGRDVFSDAMPLVFWPQYDWKTDLGTYNHSTGIFTPAPGVEVDESYVEYINALVRGKITYSKSVQNYDYFNYITDALQGEDRE